eukprot:3659474-Amphidinium_carterae.1
MLIIDIRDCIHTDRCVRDTFQHLAICGLEGLRLGPSKPQSHRSHGFVVMDWCTVASIVSVWKDMLPAATKLFNKAGFVACKAVFACKPLQKFGSQLFVITAATNVFRDPSRTDCPAP